VLQTTSSRAGNGSPAGAAARWFIRRKIDAARKYLRAHAAEFPLDFKAKRRNLCGINSHLRFAHPNFRRPGAIPSSVAILILP
jgi:hypothetical protein